jgi:hypothetical protein
MREAKVTRPGGYMPTGITDPNGTLLEAERDGVSRRAVQLRRKKLREQIEQVEEAHNIPPLPGRPLLAGVEVGPPKRISPLTAAARAGALELAICRRLEQAIENGDLAAVKLLSASWKEVLAGLVKLEEAAAQEESRRRTMKRNREMGIAGF